MSGGVSNQVSRRYARQVFLLINNIFCMICFAIFSNSGKGMKTHAISKKKNKYASGNRQLVSTALMKKKKKNQVFYTTFILGPALLNFGTRAVNLGHSLRHLHDKNKLNLFQC